MVDVNTQGLWTDAAFGPQSAFLMLAIADGRLLEPEAAHTFVQRLHRPRSQLLRSILKATRVPMVDRFDRLAADRELRARALVALAEVFRSEPGGDEARAELLEVLQETVDALGEGVGPLHAAALRRAARVLGPGRLGALGGPIAWAVLLMVGVAAAVWQAC